MIQQMVAPCNECGGQGKIIPKKDRCKECNGQRTKRVSKEFEVSILYKRIGWAVFLRFTAPPLVAQIFFYVIGQMLLYVAAFRLPDSLSNVLLALFPVIISMAQQVHIDPGMRDGERVTFAGEGDQAPGIPPGDVVVVLREKTHEVCRIKIS